MQSVGYLTLQELNWTLTWNGAMKKVLKFCFLPSHSIVTHFVFVASFVAQNINGFMTNIWPIKLSALHFGLLPNLSHSTDHWLPFKRKQTIVHCDLFWPNSLKKDGQIAAFKQYTSEWGWSVSGYVCGIMKSNDTKNLSLARANPRF